MKLIDMEGLIESILFAAGEPVNISRLALALETDESTVNEVCVKLRDMYEFEQRGIRLVFMDKAIQLCSAPEHADIIRRVLEARKPPTLSQQAMEVLSIIAYFQPVTKSYIEQIRGVDSAYTVGTLVDRGLIETCGRLNVPGRPRLYRTTASFLRSFNITSLDELPELPETDSEARTEDGLTAEELSLRLSESQQQASEEPEI